ncbi:MAG: radical SAM protein [Candidatus Marsarchaeota archaeon]|nr:radical SAM protein [Candidatus Marsarchaeota archaeon]
MNRNLRILLWLARNYGLGKYDWPAYITFKTTTVCNLRCAYCNPTYWNGSILPVDTPRTLKIIDNMAKSSAFVLSFEGGEPTLRPDLIDLLKRAHENSFYTFVTTNGTRLFDLPLHQLAENLDYLHISIDEYHNNMRLFDKLGILREAGLKVNVQTVVSSKTLSRLEEKVKRVREHKFKLLAMPVIDYPGNMRLSPDPAAYRAELQRLKGIYGGTLNNSMDYIDAWSGGYECKSMAVQVEPNGDLVYPCDFKGGVLGNLAEYSLGELLSCDKAKKMKSVCSTGKPCGQYLHMQTSAMASIGGLVRYGVPMMKWTLSGRAD